MKTWQTDKKSPFSVWDFVGVLEKLGDLQMMQVMSLVIFLCTKQSSTQGHLFKVIIENLQNIKIFASFICGCGGVG